MLARPFPLSRAWRDQSAVVTHCERILTHLRANAAGADDHVLVTKLGIPNRHAVNQVCHRLEAEGLVARQYDQDAGKIVNRVVRGAHIEGSSIGSVTTTPPAHDQAVHLSGPAREDTPGPQNERTEEPAAAREAGAP